MSSNESPLAPRIIPPLSQAVFPALFADCEKTPERERCVVSLLNCIIGGRNSLLVEKILSSSIEESIPGTSDTQRLCRIDLELRIQDGSICIVELQLSETANIIPRLLAYFGRHRSRNLPVGKTDYAMPKYALITMVDYHLDILNDEHYHLYNTLVAENAPHIKLSEDFQIHLVSMHRFRELGLEAIDELTAWMRYFSTGYQDEDALEGLVAVNENVRLMHDFYRTALGDPEVQKKHDWEMTLQEDWLASITEHKQAGRVEERKEGQEDRDRLQSEIDKRDALIAELRAQLAKQGKE